MTTKYVIELGDDVQFVAKVGVTASGNAYSLGEYKVDLEVLNSDYINEHYGELQDEAYHKGYDDGKKYFANGCVGCQYEDDENRVIPCCECARVCDDHYIPKRSDSIKVGDIVDVYGNLGVVTYTHENGFNVMMYDGSVGYWKQEDLKKTGKHYDIQSILEAMKS